MIFLQDFKVHRCNMRESLPSLHMLVCILTFFFFPKQTWKGKKGEICLSGFKLCVLKEIYNYAEQYLTVLICFQEDLEAVSTFRFELELYRLEL